MASVQESLLFLRSIKKVLPRDQLWKYEEFLQTLVAAFDRADDVGGREHVLDRANQLFSDHPEILLSFSEFLSPDHHQLDAGNLCSFLGEAKNRLCSRHELGDGVFQSLADFSSMYSEGRMSGGELREKVRMLLVDRFDDLFLRFQDLFPAAEDDQNAPKKTQTLPPDNPISPTSVLEAMKTMASSSPEIARAPPPPASPAPAPVSGDTMLSELHNTISLSPMRDDEHQDWGPSYCLRAAGLPPASQTTELGASVLNNYLCLKFIDQCEVPEEEKSPDTKKKVKKIPKKEEKSSEEEFLDMEEKMMLFDLESDSLKAMIDLLDSSHLTEADLRPDYVARHFRRIYGPRNASQKLADLRNNRRTILVNLKQRQRRHEKKATVFMRSLKNQAKCN